MITAVAGICAACSAANDAPMLTLSRSETARSSTSPATLATLWQLSDAPDDSHSWEEGFALIAASLSQEHLSIVDRDVLARIETVARTGNVSVAHTELTTQLERTPLNPRL